MVAGGSISGYLANRYGWRVPLLTLGGYAPGERSGPAYWLRAVLGLLILATVLADMARRKRGLIQ